MSALTGVTKAPKVASIIKGINFFMPLDIVTWNYIGVYNPHKLCGREHFHLFKGYG